MKKETEEEELVSKAYTKYNTAENDTMIITWVEGRDIKYVYGRFCIYIYITVCI